MTIENSHSEQMSLQDHSRIKCGRLQTQLATTMVDMVIWMENIAAVGQALDDQKLVRTTLR